MWREESGFLEMFLAYYSQFEQNLTEQKTYRDFLFSILDLHEMSLSLDALPVSVSKAKTAEKPPDIAGPRRMSALNDVVTQLEARLATKDLELEAEMCAQHAFEIDSQEASLDVAMNFPVKLESQDIEDHSSLADVDSLKTDEGPAAYDLDIRPRIKQNTMNSDFNSIINQMPLLQQYLSKIDVPAPVSIASSSSKLEPDDENPEVCDNVLELPNGSQQGLPTDSEVAHSDGKFQCRLCDKVFIRYYDMQKHERNHSGIQPYLCRICNKSFNHSSNLLRHERAHFGGRHYKCDVCGKDFSEVRDLNRHERVHTGERPFECKTCGKSFTQSSNLVRHERSHTDERPYKCNICMKAFNDPSTLKKHQKIHSRHVIPAENESVGFKFPEYWCQMTTE